MDGDRARCEALLFESKQDSGESGRDTKRDAAKPADLGGDGSHSKESDIHQKDALHEDIIIIIIMKGFFFDSYSRIPYFVTLKSSTNRIPQPHHSSPNGYGEGPKGQSQ